MDQVEQVLIKEATHNQSVFETTPCWKSVDIVLNLFTSLCLRIREAEEQVEERRG